MEKNIAEASEKREEDSVIELHDIPGGAKTFELVAQFCYGVKLELTIENVVYLKCAAENLEMTEEYGEGNLISLTDTLLNQVILRRWKGSIKALQTCVDVLPYVEDLRIVIKCIKSLAAKARNDPNLFGWHVVENSVPM